MMNSIQVSERSCLYISKSPIWPFLSEEGENKAEAKCNEMGISLAANLQDDEKQALLEVTRKRPSEICLSILIGIIHRVQNGCSY